MKDFLTSLVFPSDSPTARAMTYHEPVQTEKDCVTLPHKSGGNMALFENCHITVYRKKNSELISEQDAENGKHVVKNADAIYHLDAYLEVEGDQIANHVSLSSPLPVGTVMNHMGIELDVFVFSGFDVILFDEKKKF